MQRGEGVFLVPVEAGRREGAIAEWEQARVDVLEALGVKAVDVRLFGYGPNQSVDGTIGNMRRFWDGVLSRL